MEDNRGTVHELLMAYGKICEEEGYLSPKAVTVRMDIASYFNILFEEKQNG